MANKNSRYVLEEYVLEGYNASSKAREDVSRLAIRYGFQPIASNDKSKIGKSKVRKAILAFLIYLKLLRKLKKGDLLFCQTSFILLKGLIQIKKIKKFKIIYLIHDIFTIRYEDLEIEKGERDKEISLLNQCEYVICHNSLMLEKLKKCGCGTKLIELQIFDYLIDDFSLNGEVKRTLNPCEVTFAGNISKSHFLLKLDEKAVNLPFEINVYGKTDIKFKNLTYCGAVEAAMLPQIIRGSFGLVWEGNYQVDEKDNYNKYNNPHKVSMYIVSCLPVIVWEKSAVAQFVKKHHVGFCVNTLDELKINIERISEKEYNSMVKNCEHIREKLIQGNYFYNAMNIIMEAERGVWQN